MSRYLWAGKNIMSQQFRIESQSLRDQLNKLLPSQNRGGIGVDLTGSTTVIPIIDLTETAEGSSPRVDLQSALSHATVTTFSVNNTTTDIVTTTGYFRVFGNTSGGNSQGSIILTDGTTAKTLYILQSSTGSFISDNFDFIVKLEAGDTLQAKSLSTGAYIAGCTRQLADLSGNLTNP